MAYLPDILTAKLTSDLSELASKGRTCIDAGRFDEAESIGGQIELITDQLFARKPPFSPAILDASNYQARLAIYNGKLVLAEIHLGFVADVCMSRPDGESTAQFADALECYSRIAMRKREWDEFAICLEKCADIRRRVLGPEHPDALRAAREWETFLDIMTDPSLD